jgi:hypothetical protein
VAYNAVCLFYELVQILEAGFIGFGRLSIVRGQRLIEKGCYIHGVVLQLQVLASVEDDDGRGGLIGSLTWPIVAEAHSPVILHSLRAFFGNFVTKLHFI